MVGMTPRRSVPRNGSARCRASSCRSPAATRTRRACATSGAAAGGTRTPRPALEDLHAERPLRDRHLRAERRLRDVARLCRVAEAAVLGDRDDILKLPQGNRQRRQAGP